MSSFPELEPPYTRVPLVHDTTDLFDPETQDALDARYSSGGGGGILPVASTTQQGIVELATNAETVTGTDTARATTPAGVAAALATVTVPDASTTTKGIVELATDGETTTGSDTTRAVTPHGLSAALAAGPYVPGARFTPTAGMILRHAATVTSVVNVNQKLTLHPVFVRDTVTVDAFLTSAAGTSGSGGDIGLYPSNSDGTPNFSSGPSRSVTGMAQGSLSVVSTFTALQLAPGIYWLAFRGNAATPTFRGYTANPGHLDYAPAGWNIETLGYADTGQASLPSGSFTPTKNVVNSGVGIVGVALRISSVP